jgi:aspartyl/asparaginyl beta-hydroxylase (cupin superfamily)
MTALIVALVAIVVLVAAAFAIKLRLESMPSKQKKKLFTKKLNRVFGWFEDKGLIARTPAFMHDYHRQYRGLKELEAGYQAVREECLALLDVKDELTDMTALGAGYTNGGIHKARWKAFMFKSGQFLDENCARAPRTTALLRDIPGLYTAFFSVLDPHQEITPHWGYYKGFLRYHLGVIIPDDNREGKCWLRVNGDPADNAAEDEALVARGEVYHWKNGEGIVFDDNYLHDAANESDEVRVVLWLDLRRRFPFYLQLYNMLCLWFVHRDSSMKKLRENARVGETETRRAA